MSNLPSRALALFTDRDAQRSVIDAYLERLRDGLGHTHGGVLSFYGVGGVGKSALREKAVADFRAKLKADFEIKPFALAEVDLDSDSVRPDMPVAYLLGRLRAALCNAGVATSLFDYAYLMWWQEEFPGQQIDLSARSRGGRVVAGALDVAEIAGNLATLLNLNLPASAPAQSLHMLFAGLYDWFREGPARKHFEHDGPQSWTQRERSERMPTLLAIDLLSFVEGTPQASACVVLDGFERVQSRESRTDAQWALATFVADVLRCGTNLPPPDGKPVRGRIGFILFGREKLRWADFYGRERVRTDWVREIDDHAQLQGLTEADARTFLLEKACGWEREQRRTAISELIERHVVEILRAASEELPGESRSYLPYYLELAVLLIRDNPTTFVPEMLGETPAELERRFLRSLDARHLRALQALAVSLEFDREIYDFLRARGDIEGYEFPWLVGDHWSFVQPVGDRPGFHGFHRHMQKSLIASLRHDEDELWARETIESLLNRLLERVRFEKPADFGPEQETALSDAIDLLREHVSDGLLDAETAVNCALTLEGCFDSLQAASLRGPFLEWSARTALSLLGPDHADTLTVRGNVASMTFRAGRPAEALELLLALQPDRERVLGIDHPDTLRTRSNVASMTSQVGRPAEALELLVALLPDLERVLGIDHPDTLSARNNIALMTGQVGRPAEALELLVALLPDLEHGLGIDHPDTLSARNNIALMTGQVGRPAEALELLVALLPDRERVCGIDHPDTLKARGNVASMTFRAGRPAEALELLLALQPDRERVLGIDRPDTLLTRNMIASLTGQAGKAGEALELLVALLPDLERVLGIDHPETLTARSNTAALEHIVAAASNPSGGAHPSRNDACPCGSGLRFKHCHGKGG